MIYLVEFEAYDTVAGAVVIERFGTDGYTTLPGDTPANTHWEERVINPGSYQQSVFADGTTSGEATAGYGFVEIAIGDDGAGNDIDRLASHAVDGRPITIHALETVRSAWASRTIIFKGTMEQIEVDLAKATIRIRDRLEDLKTPVQTVLYAGTTTDGTKTDAEGRKDDLKDKPKPLQWGVTRNVPGVYSNRYKQIFDFAANGVASFLEVRDRGVALTAGANHASFALLLAASVAAGQYATCNATGQIKTGSAPAGDITADIVSGSVGDRSAPKVARRILEHKGFVAGTDFSTADLDALHALNPAEVGYWVGAEEQETLGIVTAVLDSIGAYMAPDPTGLLRFGRIEIGSAAGAPVLDESNIIQDGFGRVATGDDRNGVPAWKVTLQYGRSWFVQDEEQLAGTAATEATKAFVTTEYRSALASNAAVKTVHLQASDLTFTSLLVDETAALAEAARRLAIYGVRRERYQTPIPPSEATGIRHGQMVVLKLDRFGLDAGKPMLAIGAAVTLPYRSGESTVPGTVVFDLFG